MSTELAASVRIHSHSKLLGMDDCDIKFFDALKVWHARFRLVSMAERYLVVLFNSRLSVYNEV